MIFETVGKGNLICHTAGPGKPTRVCIDLHHWIIEFPTFPVECSILAHEQVQRKKNEQILEKDAMQTFLIFLISVSHFLRISELNAGRSLHSMRLHATQILLKQRKILGRGKNVLCFICPEPWTGLNNSEQCWFSSTRSCHSFWLLKWEDNGAGCYWNTQIWISFEINPDLWGCVIGHINKIGIVLNFRKDGWNDL